MSKVNLNHIWQVLYKRQELLTLREHMGSLPVFRGVRVAIFFLVFCVLFVLVLFLVWPIINVVSFSGFLIAPLVFSNLYYQSIVARKISTKYFCHRYLKKKHCNIDKSPDKDHNRSISKWISFYTKYTEVNQYQRIKDLLVLFSAYWTR
jgi:hypothetical protein